MIIVTKDTHICSLFSVIIAFSGQDKDHKSMLTYSVRRLYGIDCNSV